MTSLDLISIVYRVNREVRPMAHQDLAKAEEIEPIPSSLSPSQLTANNTDEVPPRKILIVSDVVGKISGVVNTLSHTERTLKDWGHQIFSLNPETMNFWTIPMVGIDREFKMAIPNFGKLAAAIEQFAPDCIHISTEGTLGNGVRRFCLQRGWQFTTAFHTMMPDFLERSIGFPAGFSWWNLRRFHRPSAGIMVPARSILEILEQRGFGNLEGQNLKIWSRGVDTELFYPRDRDEAKYPKQNEPILMYVGRVSVEKGIEEFLKIPIEKGTKYIVGDGPQREFLQKKYPDVVFLGYLTGEELAAAYANADVVVFPSKTDTFGNTITEALASGTPVAAFPAPGPIDIIGSNRQLGSLNNKLAVAIQNALKSGNSEACVRYVRQNYTWEIASRQFLNHLVFVT
ncbi:glycosyltransferase family 1 protein [Oscillatoriales cyanobacterium LEGE 11467]|uniref:Glycosyltransferase family 1 protein n=1 Tax=Zarconia navalis LEGE 11467 TaxID=1828826 RepID=A0A928W1G2_9CYAN|nr:glycosyltransferase family 1 protein [Zarconia navalis]MBE9042226.1 glycosyltransferase family 1 protein [Zarconia navalis LEGE 11467]